jgi:hypothetical protein
MLSVCQPPEARGEGFARSKPGADEPARGSVHTNRPIGHVRARPHPARTLALTIEGQGVVEGRLYKSGGRCGPDAIGSVRCGCCTLLLHDA